MNVFQDSRKEADTACQFSCVEFGKQSQVIVRIEVFVDKA